MKANDISIKYMFISLAFMVLDGLICLCKIQILTIVFAFVCVNVCNFALLKDIDLCNNSSSLKLRRRVLWVEQKTLSFGKIQTAHSKVIDADKAYPVDLEYTWNRQVYRKSTK